MKRFSIEFLDSGREPQCPPDPKYPKGRDIDITKGEIRACMAKLDYPAPRCGVMLIECLQCGTKVGITVAGRPDDPKTVKIPCRTN